MRKFKLTLSTGTLAVKADYFGAGANYVYFYNRARSFYGRDECVAMYKADTVQHVEEQE